MLGWSLIAAGGALGSVLRYAVQSAAQRWIGAAFPLGTLIVNLAGCLAIGMAAPLLSQAAVRAEYRLGLTVGVLGGFTTFSAFGLESLHLAQAGQWAWSAANVVLSCGLGLAGVWVGQRLVSGWCGG
jgi:CrcB protein